MRPSTAVWLVLAAVAAVFLYAYAQEQIAYAEKRRLAAIRKAQDDEVNGGTYAQNAAAYAVAGAPIGGLLGAGIGALVGLAVTAARDPEIARWFRETF